MVRKTFFIISIISMLFVIASCDSLWTRNQHSDILFSIDSESLIKAMSKAESTPRPASSDNEVEVIITIRNKDTQEKEAEKTLYFTNDEHKNQTISFNNLDIVGKTLFAELQLKNEDTILIGRSETKKILRGTNILHISEVNPLSSIDMISVLQGSFVRDSDHTVNLSTFDMGKTEVTQGEWIEIMGTWPNNEPNAVNGVGEKFPAYYVSWYDAVRFCNKLTELEMGEEHQVYTISGDTVTQDLTKKGYRLPTEAEWEYAAGGGGISYLRTLYAGTNSASDLEQYAWYSVNSGPLNDPKYGTKEVEKKVINKLGLFDMSGNVSEWCWDWYADYGNGDKTNPQGATSGENKVHRGGYWNSNNASFLEVSARASYSPSKIDSTSVGFRLARSK